MVGNYFACLIFNISLLYTCDQKNLGLVMAKIAKALEVSIDELLKSKNINMKFQDLIKQYAKNQ